MAVENTTVVRRIGYHCIKRFVFVRSCLRVSTHDNGLAPYVGELGYRINLVLQSKGQTSGCFSKWIDLRKIIDHLECLAIADRGDGFLILSLPAAKFREGI